MARTKYFPHLAGSLILASAAVVGGTGLLDRWEPAKGKPDAHLYVYADKLAQSLPTVCNGITKHVATIPVIVGEKWTQQMCDQQEEQAVSKVQNTLAQCFKTLPPQSVFDAATSHAWNFGTGRTCGSGAMKQWNIRNYKLGCQLIAFEYDGTTPNWSYADGKFRKGLHNRRIDEMNTCFKDVK
jgi:GH24 family phage-related lysozyme (muramidase)